MEDVLGCFLWPPHGTTPATVIANKHYNCDPLKAVNILVRNGMCHTMVSAT